MSDDDRASLLREFSKQFPGSATQQCPLVQVMQPMLQSRQSGAWRRRRINESHEAWQREGAGAERIGQACYCRRDCSCWWWL